MPYSLNYIVGFVLSHLDTPEHEVFTFENVSFLMFERIIKLMIMRKGDNIQFANPSFTDYGVLVSFNITPLHESRLQYPATFQYWANEEKLRFWAYGPTINQESMFSGSMCNRCGKVLLT